MYNAGMKFEVDKDLSNFQEAKDRFGFVSLE
jgi:hypothetical protein